jgi:broad specificity phosphatase PhoE
MDMTLAEIAAKALSLNNVHLLMRHGAREKITSATVQGALMAPLTEAGRQQARELGATMPRETLLRLAYSPVPRCHDTAKCLAEGFETSGGAAQLVGVKSVLGASFVRDEKALIRSIATSELRGFIVAWAQGELGDEVIQPLDEASGELLSSLLDVSCDADRPCVDVSVSHDIVLMALLALAWDVTNESVPWPNFLDGIAIWKTDEHVSLWYRGEERRIELPHP